MMRTNDQILKIKKTIDDPRVVKDFLSQEEIFKLIEIFKNQKNLNSPYSNLTKKNTGPITLDLSLFLNEDVIRNLLERLEKILGNFEITAAFFFKTDYPHIIHNDDTYELPETVYKGITLPLELDGFNGIFPKLCFFNQFYFHGPAKFFKNSNNIPTYYNKQIYDYKDVEGLVNDKFIDNDNYFTHLTTKWLEGLSLHSVIDWIPGDAIIFDSVRLHCASDFRNLGIKSKLGISIFTKK